MQVVGEAYIITPVGTVLRLLQVPAMPAVSVFDGEHASARDLLGTTRTMTYLWYARS